MAGYCAWQGMGRQVRRGEAGGHPEPAPPVLPLDEAPTPRARSRLESTWSRMSSSSLSAAPLPLWQRRRDGAGSRDGRRPSEDWSEAVITTGGDPLVMASLLGAPPPLPGGAPVDLAKRAPRRELDLDPSPEPAARTRPASLAVGRSSSERSVDHGWEVAP